MPNISRLLKDEISRLSRREIRNEIASLQKTASVHRRDIAALKRHISSLERQVRDTAKRSTRVVSPITPPEKFRFRADGFRTLRQRLGLSAEAMGKLIGVSGQSIYAWETKRASPRRSQLPAIAALRGAGKREVLQRLNGGAH